MKSHRTPNFTTKLLVLAIAVNPVLPRARRVVYLPRPTPKPNSSWLTQAATSAGPAVLGSGGVIFGGALTWYTLRRKNKTFDIYFQRISQAQKNYSANHDRSLLKSELTSIQEEVELAVARKKLDQEQLIAVSNKVKRILEEEV